MSAGRMADAIGALESTLKLKEAHLGPDNPRTLLGRGNLAFTYLQAGRFAEAITLLEAVLKGWESKYGPDHVDTLICRDNLARSYLAAGRPPRQSSSPSRRSKRTNRSLALTMRIPSPAGTSSRKPTRPPVV